MTSREPPYPADTRAKGWRFELDYEQIDQSDTWDIAAEIPMCQHALLMMWLVAWRQEPCGSLPNDEAVIRAKCKIPPKVWAQCGPILMRGWWPAVDGRLYHKTLTSRVLEMLEYRRKEAERRKRNRGEPPLSRGTDAEQRGTPDTGTGTSSTPSVQKKAPRKRAAAPPPIDRPDGVAEQTWTDWVALRRKKRADVSQTVVDEAAKEAVKAGLTLDAFLRVWCLRGSQGLQADWLRPAERGQGLPPPPQETFRERDERRARERYEEMTGKSKRAEVIDVTATVLD
jgi:hypothetical protein